MVSGSLPSLVPSTFVNPHRRLVLSWYHKICRSAFTFPWNSDDDALYVISEARRLFRQNMWITDINVIQRKIDEAEMRYGIAVHYKIPYPRPSHKVQGSGQESSVAYHPAFDSLYDNEVSPRSGDPRCVHAVSAFYGGNAEASATLLDEDRGVVDTNDGRRARPD